MPIDATVMYKQSAIDPSQDVCNQVLSLKLLDLLQFTVKRSCTLKCSFLQTFIYCIVL